MDMNKQHLSFRQRSSPIVPRKPTQIESDREFFVAIDSGNRETGWNTPKYDWDTDEHTLTLENGRYHVNRYYIPDREAGFDMDSYYDSKEALRIALIHGDEYPKNEDSDLSIPVFGTAFWSYFKWK